MATKKTVEKPKDDIKKVGRPSAFNSPEELSIKIDDYFKSITGYKLSYKGDIITDVNGEPVKDFVKAPSMVGLALFLGVHKDTLYEYLNNKSEEFSDPIIRARETIESWTNEQLFDRDKYKGAAFSLSVNYGYTEKKALEVTAQDIEIKLV